MPQVKKIISDIESTSSLEELDSLRIYYLGKKGTIKNKFSELKDCSFEEKKVLGKELNAISNQVTQAIDHHKEKLMLLCKNKQLAKETLDITLPARPVHQGKKHVITNTIDEATKTFAELGFKAVSGPDVDDEFHIFDALNTPSHHPARQMQDSFYLTNGLMLRPHTSSVQIHTMKNGKPPFKIVAPGRVYRHDWDMTHTPMFHQIEGLLIDTDINMAHLKYCIEYFLKKFFGEVKSRFRPSFFPFTEPSAEVDIEYNNSWMEILGCGMVHKNVLKNVGIDHTKYQGFAFGIGIERLAMLKHNITDLRLMFESYIPWLKSYGVSKTSQNS